MTGSVSSSIFKIKIVPPSVSKNTSVSGIAGIHNQFSLYVCIFLSLSRSIVSSTHVLVTMASAVDGWEQFFDEASGLPYYHNAKQNVTVWERPEGLEGSGGHDVNDQVIAGADPDHPMHWEEYVDDETGQQKFHNNITGEDTEEKPDCLKTDEEKLFKKDWWNPKGYKPSHEFPSTWRQPPKYPACEAEMLSASDMIWNEPHMAIFRINQWTSNKPQRYKLTTEDIPSVGWMYNFSFFAYTRYRPDTHRYEVVQKKRPVRSTISPLLLLETKNTVRNGEKGVAPVVSGRRLLNNEDVGAPKDFSFYAFADPREGLARVNVHDMEDPDRHKVTSRPPIGYWFQRFHFFALPTQIWNVKEAWEPHRFLVTKSPHEFDGWVQCYSFFAFTRLSPGMKVISIHERQDDMGCLRYKISCGGAHSGWSHVDSFYAFDSPVRGTTRFFVQIDRNPERYRIDFFRALPPWTDHFSFYAYFVPFGNEVILNHPNKDSL